MIGQSQSYLTYLGLVNYCILLVIGLAYFLTARPFGLADHIIYISVIVNKQQQKLLTRNIIRRGASQPSLRLFPLYCTIASSNPSSIVMSYGNLVNSHQN